MFLKESVTDILSCIASQIRKEELPDGDYILIAHFGTNSSGQEVYLWKCKENNHCYISFLEKGADPVESLTIKGGEIDCGFRVSLF